MPKARDQESAFKCEDCGREEPAEFAGEAAYPRACRVCGGPNFTTVNGYKPSGTNAPAGRLVAVDADDTVTTTDKS